MLLPFRQSRLQTILPGLTLGLLLLLGGSALPTAQAAASALAPGAPQSTLPCVLAARQVDGTVTRYRCGPRLNEATALQYLGSQPGVKLVVPVRQYRLAVVPNDPGYRFQSAYLERIHAPEAWDKPTVPNLRPTIAILDSGVDVDNPDLKPNLWFNPGEVPGDRQDNDGNGYADDQYGWDFVQNVPDPRPKFDSGWNEVAMNHGTIVAGVAGAASNNGLGVTGVAWQARVMPIRVLDGRGVGDTVTVAKGIGYAIRNHADIINLSFVGSLSDPILEDAINQAYRAGVLVVAAAGNEAAVGVDMDREPQYPVCDDGANGENEVIGVAALDENNVLASFSNFGTRCIDLSAPGTHVYSTQLVAPGQKGFEAPYGGYWSGTSVAAPMVSGALAVLKSTYPRLSPSQLRDVAIASGDELTHANPGLLPGKLGRRLNLQAALQLAGSAKFPVKSPMVVAPQSGNPAEVATYDVSGELIDTFLAYSPSFTRGINLGVGDVDGDGQADIVTAPRAGGGPHLRIFNQRGELQFQFMAFPEAFRGGVSIALADFTGDGRAEIVAATGRGGSNLVRIFDTAGTVRYQFVPYDPGYSGGVNVAVGDVDGDGQPEVVTAPQGTARLPVRVFDKFGRKKAEFYPYQGFYRGGVNLGVGDVDGDGTIDIVTAPGAGGPPQVRVWNYKGKQLRELWAYAKSFRGGVNLGGGDVDGDGLNEIVTTAGAGGGPHLRAFTRSGEVRTQFFAGPESFRGGLSLALYP